MDDDFNTPEAIAVLFELAREINRKREADPGRASALVTCLLELGGTLGLLQSDPEAYLREGGDPDAIREADIEALIENRLQARKEKNWAEADRIREELEAAGVVLEDGPAGTSWRRS